MEADNNNFEKRALAAEKKVEELTAKLAALTTPSQAPETKAEESEESKLLDAPPKNTNHIPQARVWELFDKQGELTAEEKYDLVRSIGEECIQDVELKNLLAKKPNPIAYDGFEPSGRMHIAQGILKAINVNKLTRSGCTFVFWVADWFAFLNQKMGGDLKKIRTVGEYMIEVWKACGMDMTNVKFVWTSEEINAHPDQYWGRVMDIATKFKLPRIIRCSTIMGRENEAELFSSQIFYPVMQCADIFHLKADICQLGLDQRKVNMLAREYCDLVRPKLKLKPIILSHHMLMGLSQGMAKMSKSVPDSAIFMEDPADMVKKKIAKSFCPPLIVEGNPCIDYVRHIVFAKNREFVINFKEGPKAYTDIDTVVADYTSGVIHPSDLKPALTEAINAILEPIRQHFETDPHAKKLLATVKSFQTTR